MGVQIVEDDGLDSDILDCFLLVIRKPIVNSSWSLLAYPDLMGFGIRKSFRKRFDRFGSFGALLLSPKNRDGKDTI